ncbi:Oxoglutarate/iron-dependent oxygenase [Ophiocordyceps sinensis CO18]|uniref:Oxoglutarate/iron-dependent oxygenase n=1 Tax=Ophiocordyceps sinensis (strain Co18 / CGMCC 3.14243) TaxID=911162 RepID=T5AA36_OPHSC|nr:Oxoglutarate/iron-dependent oxygenase [Ophiocordyceps sinensis CO18]
MATNSPVVTAIPVINLDGDQAQVARQLVSAAEEHGFIYIRNLGNDIAAADSKQIFDASAGEKQRCSIKNNRGWAGMHVEALDPKNQKLGDFKEAFNFGEFVDAKARQPLPSTVAHEEPHFSAFADSCRSLCHKILYLLGLGLHVGDFFSSAHFTSQDGSGTTLRFLRYPPAESTAHSARDIRAGAHSDYGSITLLFRLRGQAGLEVLDKDDTWAPVPVCPPGTEADPSPPILVNIGDLLSYWTNGLFRSTVHRVVFPTAGSGAVVGESSSGTRYSIAFFCHPVNSSRLEPVPSQRVQDYAPAGDASDTNPYAKRKVVTAEQHLNMRLKASYGALLDRDEAS